MDPLSDVLSLLEPQSYRIGGFEAGGDWAIRFGKHEGIKCYAVTAGEGWLAVDGIDEPIHLKAGDCYLLLRGWPFRIGSDLKVSAEDWQRYFPSPTVGGLAQINGGGGLTSVGGHFTLFGDQARALLDMLPPIIHLRSESDRVQLRESVERMRAELADPQPGSFLVAQQLAYMILITGIRLHLASEEGQGVGWLFALADKHIGAAIGAIHAEPRERWTVAGLAARVGMSRSGFAARFRDLVGETPIEYLTRWRMLLAGRSLSRGEPVATIARSLGYESESAFNAAFRRVMGAPPRRYARERLAEGSR